MATPADVDASVGELDGAERRELQRLLKEELARRAAREQAGYEAR